MFYREAGDFKVSYQQDSQTFPIKFDRYRYYFVLAVAFGLIPFLINDYWANAILLPFLIYAAFMIWVKGVAPSAVTRTAPILWLLAAGFACLFIGILALVEFSGGERDGTYRPPAIEDGVIKPGRVD